MKRWRCKFCGGRIAKGLLGMWWHLDEVETLHVARPER